ncbi:hypothetical protein J3F84DRAFT_97254 [Trichoderma pleuroticola]
MTAGILFPPNTWLDYPSFHRPRSHILGSRCMLQPKDEALHFAALLASQPKKLIDPPPESVGGKPLNPGVQQHHPGCVAWGLPTLFTECGLLRVRPGKWTTWNGQQRGHRLPVPLEPLLDPQILVFPPSQQEIGPSDPSTISHTERKSHAEGLAGWLASSQSMSIRRSATLHPFLALFSLWQSRHRWLCSRRFGGYPLSRHGTVLVACG